MLRKYVFCTYHKIKSNRKINSFITKYGCIGIKVSFLARQIWKSNVADHYLG
jgi:hypothetical protein